MDCVADCETDCDAEECIARFETHVITTSADFVRAVLTANIDADGFLDVVAVSSGDNSVAWYQQEQTDFGKEGGISIDFIERPTTSNAQNARAIAVGDINGDGALDIVTGFLFEVAWHQGNVAEACDDFDATMDGEMDGEELAQIGGGFGQTCLDPENPDEWWLGVDYNEDCQIDGTDLAILTSTGVWGHCTSDAVVAETCSEELLCTFTCP